MVKNVYREQVCLNGIRVTYESSESENAKSRVKTMLTASSDAKGIIHHEFVLEKQTKR
jgi:hypothetical protein